MLLSRLRLSPRRRRPALHAFLTALVCWINLALNLGTGLAGDILRGAGSGPQSRGASAAGGNAPAAAVQAGVSGTDTLSRTTMALQAVRNMQAAAHAAARTNNNAGADPNHPGQMLPNVPNGLGVGGLQVAPGVPANLGNAMPGENPALWQGANLPTQTTSTDQTHVTVTQTAQQAILNWQTFNIGKDTRLTFDQTAGGANASQWIAFNKINDPSGVPSQILGSLDAVGQVYVINANGIIFGGGSQLNLHSLVASALPINDNLITRGLLNNPDFQFLFSALPLPAGSNGTPAFIPPASNTPNGNYGDVTVQAGAQITSPSNADNVGGRVTLIGANVTNDGTITTPDGQAILAAGLQVGFAAHASTDPTLRGLDVYVGQVGTYGGTATNNGLLEAPEADVTIAGRSVNQFGFINSSTSVSLNGRIDLLADYNAISDPNTVQQNPPPFLFTSTGLVTLGPGSVTQIVPEYSSTERIVGTQLALNSAVFIQGLGIHDDVNSTLFAPSGAVSFAAGVWRTTGTGTGLNDTFVFSDGQVYLDAGAIIDVSGTANVDASVSETIVKAQLLGSELANSPLQRNGPLRGQTVFVDINQSGTFNGQTWIGTPLGDVSGYVNLVQRTVGELTTNGGTVNINAGNSVILQPGAAINVSGGSINYQGGIVQTTQVLDTNGRVYDISQATPDRVYAGILNGFADVHQKWGIVNTFQSSILGGGHFEQGYVQGANGGAISITAPSMALDGTLTGTTISGPRQRLIAPTPAALALTFQAQSSTPVSGVFLPVSPTPPDIVFASASDLPVAGPFAVDSTGRPVDLPPARQQEVILSSDLLGTDSFGKLTLTDKDGNISVPSGVSLAAPAGGSIILFAANLDIAGQVSAPGGNLSFTAYDISPYLTLSAAPPPDPTRGRFVLEGTGTLTTAGLVVDDRPSSSTAGTLPLATAGGSVSITGFNVDLLGGSRVDVSGGIAVSGAGGQSFGNGGSISIVAGQDANVKGVASGSLFLEGSLTGFSGAKGGSLSLQDVLVRIGGQSSDPGTLALAPSFFNQGGFANFTITGLGESTGVLDQDIPAVVVEPGTVIAPQAQKLIAHVAPNGGISLSPILLGEGLRSPTSITLIAAGVRDNFQGTLLARGDLVFSGGAQLTVDPTASVTLKGDTVVVLGDVTAPGGTISISGGTNSTSLFLGNQQQALVTVDLGPQSRLSTAGTTVLTPNSFGLRTGSVLDGGKINVSGNIVAEAGSVLDVSGATDVLDLDPGFSGRTNASAFGAFLIPTRVASNGGSITFNGGQELFVDAALNGAGGGTGAVGGTLSISSGRFDQLGVQATPLDPTLAVSESGPTISYPFYPAGGTAIGQTVSAPGGSTGMGFFAADTFNHSGFDSLNLLGTVQFVGPVNITANRSISVASAGVLIADSQVQLDAPYVRVGTSFAPPLAQNQPTNALFLGGSTSGSPFFLSPRNGAGSLSISSSLIDVGNLSLQGIGNANLVATNGDVRGDGTFDIAGNLSITAGQVYPTTANQFTIAAYDYTVGQTLNRGSISLTSSGTRPLPLSAGGQLNVYSSNIIDDGVLRAPLGSINVGWNGTGTAPTDRISGLNVPIAQQVTLSENSITSVSAIDPVTGNAVIIPYGVNPTGVSWVDPAGNDITTGGVPQKTVTVSGINVSDLPGSTIDLRGGGDLYAYRFVSGTGGTIDVLNTSSSFALIPGYAAGYAPYAPYNSTVSTTDLGYANTNLSVGDQVYLNAGNGLPAGVYTLLPARYALLPSAFLVTPQSGTPIPAVQQPDGSSLVSGYRFNGFDAPASAPLFSSFQVAPASVVRQRAQYSDYLGNSFLKQGALINSQAVPRLPVDAGQLLFTAINSVVIQGSVTSSAPDGGLGSLIDISSPVDILIAGAGVSGAPGELLLDSSSLTAFGAGSLLVGGFRQTGPNGTTVTVTANNLTVDNAGSSLTGPDIILAANNSLTLAPNADVEASGTISNAGTLFVSGNGALLRVSADSSAQILRTNANPSQPASMVIGAGAKVSGASLILDSSSATSLDPTAMISGKAVFIDSGQISLQLASVGNPTGLVLSSESLQSLQNGADSLSLLSYSSIDIYGVGDIGALDSTGQPTLVSLALHAAEIRGFDLAGGTVNFNAQTILLDNAGAGTTLGAIAPIDGSLVFNAGIIRLGAHQLNVDQFASLNLNAANGVLFQGSGGLATAGSLTISTPLITGATAAQNVISAAGAVDIETISGATAKVTGGLGTNLTVIGAGITENSSITLPSGQLTLHATSGDVSVGGSLDASGTQQTFFDATRYTSGGDISLIADAGNVDLTSTSIVTVAAQSDGGNGGGLTITAVQGNLVSAGALSGAGGTNGTSGSFSLDIESLPSLTALNTQLNSGNFDQSRSFRIRSGDVTVDGSATSHTFDVSADEGSINVTGMIDASGATGGRIDLIASGSVTLSSGATLTVAAQNFDSAGKGGEVSLEAGSEVNGVIDPNAALDIQTGSKIDLSVAANTPNSESLGDFTGTLHLRAPQTAGGTDLQMKPISGTITGASSIVVEGYAVFDASADGSIDNQEANVFANGQSFGGNGAAIANRLLANNSSLQSVLVVVPGAEIINRSGDLTLGFDGADASSDWNLSTYRFGPNNVPGVLTLRAQGNIVFYNALSDGFDPSQSQADDPNLALWLAPLMARNAALLANVQSWSYNITAGADFSAANTDRLQSIGSLASGSGSVMLGQNAGTGVASSGFSALTSDAVYGHFQVIRTGTGDISVNAARDVQLLNAFATIYTAGGAVADPTMGGTFALPNIDSSSLAGSTTGLGAIQQLYPAQYSYAGGNVSIHAQNDITHLTQNIQGDIVPDSSRELPTNWLYRRGYVDPATGLFGTSKYGEVASTTWWVDFSNFFEGVGTFGGGNVSLVAGHDVSNVDAVAATNARMPGVTPVTSNLLELGGGDVTVLAGNNINAGVYYVERGNGVLHAGNSIVTNSTRSPSLGSISVPATIFPSATWLPTTLFVGKGRFDVSANDDVLLGPVANPFLLPGGVNNTFWYKTYFSTYALTDSVNVASLAGDVTLRESVALPGGVISGSEPMLQAWYEQQDLLKLGNNTFPLYQPWLRLDEDGVSPFNYVFSLQPATFHATAFSGDINLVGNMILSPSPTGNLSLAAADSVNALQPDGVATPNGRSTTLWTNSTIDVSDSDPNAVPGAASPFANQVLAGTSIAARNTNQDVLDTVNRLFKVSGSTTGAFAVLQTKQALHAPGILHADDPQDIQIYAEDGDISGLTLFSPTETRIVAGRDITDVGLYLQNVSANDISVVSAGRDIIAFDPNSPLRGAAQSAGSALSATTVLSSGDIQLGGPGTLEVLAGRNLNLGIGPVSSDGTGSGISTIGDTSNPYLPFQGANVVASAGVGGAVDLASLNNAVDFDHFVAQFLDPSGANSARYLPDLATLLGLGDSATNSEAWAAFQQLSKSDQALRALDIFYLVIRDAGRDHNNPDSPNFGNYDGGFAAVMALFPSTTYAGDISLTSRAIKTTNGGDISLLAPGGALNVGVNVAGAQAADQGILTQFGGNINIFTHGDVNVGTSRIFTLRGGNEIIWSSAGSIAAGSSSKTVLAAPPTRVLVDPQSADVRTDLAGLATGGGIGVLESVSGVPPADVDLIAPVGTVDAGDAGIRVSGNINIAALIVLNVGNIQVGGSSSGIPAVAAPNLGGLTNASNTTAASSEAAAQIASQNTAPVAQQDSPSVISVEVIGYGGGGDDQDEEERRKKKQGEQPQTSAEGDSVRLSSLGIAPAFPGSSL